MTRILSEAMKYEIRKKRNTPCTCCGCLVPVKVLADKYGVSATTISQVANGKA